MKYRTIVGLETHIELKTDRKMFCDCKANYFGEEPNTRTCPVCLGLPGALPVPNEEAVRFTLLIGLALNCKINTESFFERKHYFYPDLPKGYQISQYLKPFCYGGHLDLENGRRVRITRVHLEEDTGKLLHGRQFNDPASSYVDFNRSGVPLVEIVTEPDIESPAEAAEYLKKLQTLVKYLGVSDADMEKGSMRAEPNISVVPEDEWLKTGKLPEYKVEIKNINSFRFVRNAIDFEEKRQGQVLSEGNRPVQETRRYIESAGTTESMRTKEEAQDYRYFPEPDIPPLSFGEEYLEKIRKELSGKELPWQRAASLKEKGLREDAVRIMVEEKQVGDAYVRLQKQVSEPAKLAMFLVNQRKQLDFTRPADILKAFRATTEKKEVDGEVVDNVLADIIKNNPQAVADYKKGKESAMQFLLGQALRQLGRQLEIHDIITRLKEKLG